jgi:hypothetical protein
MGFQQINLEIAVFAQSRADIQPHAFHANRAFDMPRHSGNEQAGEADLTFEC